MIDDRAGRWSDAEPWSLVTGGPGDGAGAGEEGRCQGRGGLTGRGGEGGLQASEAALDERVAEQTVCSGPPLLLHKHLPQEVPASVGHALGKHGLCRLGGNLKNGCHGLVLRPWRFLGQHFHNSAGNTPEEKQHPGEVVDCQNFIISASNIILHVVVMSICIHVYITLYL